MLAPAIWAGLGFQIVIFLAGLRAIPVTYYEAARIDGLSEWSDPAQDHAAAAQADLVFLVVFSSIGFLRIFDQVYNINTNDPGGPLNATKPLVLMIYETAFSSYEMGYAAAQTVVLFVILLVDLPRPAAPHERPLMKDSRILPGPCPLSRIRPGRIIAWTLLFIGGVVMVTPLLYMLSTSLKDASQVYDLR